MDDLVKRLREEAIMLSGIGINRGSVDASLDALLADEAAAALEAKEAEIAALRAEVARLRDELGESDAPIPPQVAEAMRRNARKAADAQDRAMRADDDHWPALQRKD